MPRSVKFAHILIAGHNESAESLFTSFLRNDGYTNIAKLGSLSDALETSRRWSPDIVLLDCDFDREAVLDLCRLLRTEAHLDGVPIIMATGSTLPETRDAIFSAGATDLIFKPIHPGELLARVSAHLEKRTLIRRLNDFQQRMADELKDARTMQESLLPASAEIRRIEARYPVKITSHYKASSGLGGDMWGVYPVGGAQLLIFNADFSGHGVSAALNTFRLHSYLLGARKQSLDPAAWLDQANRFLCDVLPVGQFATMFCAVIDFQAETLCYACASSPPHLLRVAEPGARFTAIDGTGIPLGVTGEAQYANLTCAFPPGSDLFLFSDALIETPSPSAPVFTPASLAAFLDRQAADRNVEAMRDAVLGVLNDEAASPPADDLTIIALRHEGGLK